MDPVLDGGPSCRHVPSKTCIYEPQAQGLQPTMPTGMGHHSLGLCQRGGHHHDQEARSCPKERQSKSKPTRRRPARSQEKVEKSEMGEEARPRRANLESVKQADLCSGAASFELCQAANEFERACNPSKSSTVTAAHDDQAAPTWSTLQTFSFSRWASSLCREVLASKTPFAAFLKTTLHVNRGPKASEKVLFPLPVPKPDAFDQLTKGGSRCRRRRSFNQAFHILVMALNFWHADYKFVPVRDLSYEPSQAQAKVLENLRAALKSFCSKGGDFSVPSSGRRSSNLIAQLADLGDFLNCQGLAATSYMNGFPGSDESFGCERLRADKSRDEVLRPYRSLDPDRLKSASPRPKKSKAVVSYGAKRWLLILVLQQFVSLASAVGHGTVLLPRDAGDRKRASTRGDLALEEGRPVLQKTQLHRDKLLTWFKEWLISEEVNFDDLILVGNPDIDAINVLLQRYGRSLFRAGRPYGHYAETVNAVAGKRPRLRRQLQPAWDLAYTWMRQEPPNHHTALPWQVLLCMLSTAISWGWPQVAGILALSWGGLTRIGEALGALRKHLVLPQDVEFTSPYILLQIGEPKTRFRAARHQVAKVDQPQLVKMIEIAFRNLAPEQRLWPYSGQTMRQRFQKLLSALRLDTLKNHLARGLDLGSLRAGGASWLLMTSEDSELTRRRGRWITSKIMEIYVQEVSSLQFMPSLPSDVKKLIVEGMTLFPWILAQADELCRARIPDQDWSLVLRNAAASTERNGYVSKKGRVGVFQDT